MNTTSPAPARLRIIIEGSDRLPLFSHEFEAYAEHVATLGITPDMLHPVIDLLLRQAALIDAPNRGWTRALALALAREQSRRAAPPGSHLSARRATWRCIGTVTRPVGVCTWSTSAGWTSRSARSPFPTWTSRVVTAPGRPRAGGTVNAEQQCCTLG
jgi:hypothetical protein